MAQTGLSEPQAFQVHVTFNQFIIQLNDNCDYETKTTGTVTTAPASIKMFTSTQLWGMRTRFADCDFSIRRNCVVIRANIFMLFANAQILGEKMLRIVWWSNPHMYIHPGAWKQCLLKYEYVSVWVWVNETAWKFVNSGKRNDKIHFSCEPHIFIRVAQICVTGFLFPLCTWCSSPSGYACEMILC